MQFSQFTFGPVVMRMFHFLNKPKEAFNLFTNRVCVVTYNFKVVSRASMGPLVEYYRSLLSKGKKKIYLFYSW